MKTPRTKGARRRLHNLTARVPLAVWLAVHELADADDITTSAWVAAAIEAAMAKRGRGM